MGRKLPRAPRITIEVSQEIAAYCGALVGMVAASIAWWITAVAR